MGGEFELINMNSPEGLEVLRHSTSHVMTDAVQRLFPGVKVTIGPSIEDGFYYDFDFESTFTPEDLKRIVKRSASLLGIEIDEDGAMEIARRSRGTPRVANRLLRRVRDFAQVAGSGAVDIASAKEALARLEVDERGLDSMDRKILLVPFINLIADVMIWYLFSPFSSEIIHMKTQHIPVIVVSGNSEEKIEKTARELGACEFLHKPVDVEALEKKLTELVGSASLH